MSQPGFKVAVGATSVRSFTGPLDGIGVYTQRLINNLQSLHCQVTPIAFPARLQPLAKDAHALRKLSSRVQTAAAALTFHLSRHAKGIDFDLFHAPDYVIPKLTAKPIVATVHDAIMLKHPEWCSPGLRRVKNWCLKQSMQRITRAIAISKACIPDIVNYWGIPAEKIDVVYQGIDSYWFNKLSMEHKQAVLKRLNLIKPFILFVGTLQPRKNLSRLLAAYKALPQAYRKEYQLVIVGKNGWQTQDLVMELAALEQAGALRWFSNLATPDLQVLYQTATLLAFPSLSEGFGLPILEAFASGLPVITSNVTSMPEIAGDAALIIDPYQVEALCAALMTLLDDTHKRQELSKRGLARVKEFTWQESIQQTLQVYRKLL
jgi:glycosyltransferase involved in cell wall biosynthesis